MGDILIQDPSEAQILTDDNKLGKWKWKIHSYELGQDNGTSVDSELFGIAAALGLAAKKVLGSKEKCVERVRVFTDCMALLDGIKEGTTCDLGPAILSPWALQDVYDHTDFLLDLGVVVELIWQKGHAYSEGNIKADWAAYEAVQTQSQTFTGRSEWKKKQDAPRGLADLGPDSLDEWCWRVNKAWLLAGLREGELPVLEEEGREGENR